MNPWAFLLIGLGLLLIIIGIKGSQHNVLQTLTGHASVTTTSASNDTGQTGPVAV